jgi:hypothetical protein
LLLYISHSFQGSLRVVEEGALVLLVLGEGKGREGAKREEKKLWGKGSYGAGFSVGT